MKFTLMNNHSFDGYGLPELEQQITGLNQHCADLQAMSLTLRARSVAVEHGSASIARKHCAARAPVCVRMRARHRRSVPAR